MYAPLGAQRSTPDYTQSSVVHAATHLPGPLAPNTIASIYGVNLAASTRALRASDIRGGRMPVTLPGTGTHILISGIAVPIYYASPTQVNFLVPAELLPGVTRLVVVVDGISGRETRIEIAPAAPGLFLFGQGLAAATTSEGVPITPANPAAPGEWITLYATGLGDTRPRATSGQLATTPASAALSFQAMIEGAPAEVGYVGLAPGYAGLYQINLLLPGGLAANPEIRLYADGVASPALVFLPVRKPD
jgi:uncharacterized protein (TIGR03437 family)